MKKILSKDEKAQAMSFDLMAAGLILLIMIGAAFTLYNDEKIQVNEQNTTGLLHLKAVNAINTILSDQNCQNGGIVNEKNILSSEKINCFNSLDYNYLKTVLSLDQQEFTITIYDANSTTLQKGYSTNKKAVAVQRVVTIGNSAKKINFVVYEK